MRKKWNGRRRADLNIQRVPAGKSIEKMLVEGELDALIHPELIQPILKKDPTSHSALPRLSGTWKWITSNARAFSRSCTRPLSSRRSSTNIPGCRSTCMQALEESKKAAYKRMENPRIVPLAWFRHFLEEQEEILGKDPWVYGLGEVNRKNLETLMQYSQEQGLIGRKMSLDELFINTAAHS